jgi:diaminopimelate decarboxylase
VASAGEIKKGFEHGLDGSRMIYSNPVKEERDIEYAAKNNVLYTTADSIDELLKIKAIAPNMKILWRISITEENSKQLATVFSNKFGDDISSLEEAHLKFSYIAKELGIKLHGIHFHCGSGKNGSSSFLKAVSIARKCLEIGRIYGHPMETLDLGGGYPSADLNDTFVSALQDTYKDPLGYQVIAEPGRHFSSHSCYLFMRVMAKRFK